MIIPMDNVPEEVEKEVTTALEDGSYETDGDLYLTDIMDPESSYLKYSAPEYGTYGGRYYQPVIKASNGTTRLRIEEAIPTAGRSIPLGNLSGTDIFVSVHITFEPYSETFDSEVLIDDDFEVSAEQDATLVEEPKYGFYSAEIEYHSEKKIVEEEWEVHESVSPTLYIVDEFGEKEPFVETSPASIRYCEWDESGELLY
ncbi:hypothetical protein C495_04862 [Natronorubrum sulfidifaciens JCM 14089]|uniref:Uncharacterized protein n=2 Tax=Natronorubrum sulfidifaciens TaxID=388259 RepID=L9WDZ6_9EURY|nr:hypothetical protein C495_04862 [Natronorubrum sulfidifaciens JCM 14089]